MNQKIKMLYLVDFIIMMISIAGMIIVNSKTNFGLAALTSVGYFVILLFVFAVSVVLLVVIFLVSIILKKKQDAA